MGKQITDDVGEMVKVGLTVYDRDGRTVGHVDQASKATGWMKVGIGELEFGRVWIPYRLVKSVDEREVFVTVTSAELLADYAEPPARMIDIVQRDGKTHAVTTLPNGYDGGPFAAGEVDLDHIRQLVAVDQRVWTADGAEIGRIKDFDATTSYVLIEKGILSRRHDLIVPLQMIAEVNRDAAEVTLAINEADLKRMQHLAPGSVVIDLPAVPGH